MGLLTEAGIFGYLAVLTFAAGIVVVLRAKDPARAATQVAAAIAGMGMMGVGLGQRLVDEYIGGVPDLAERVMVLSAGTREASANLLLGGACALALVLLGAAVRAARSERT